MSHLQQLAATCAVMFVAVSSASAEPLGNDFGARGQFIISADRLSPLLSYSRVKVDQGGGDSTTTSTTSMSFFWAGDVQDFYDIPRAGLDYVIAPNLTLGGTLFFTLPMSSTREDTQNGTTTSRDAAKTNAFGLGDRIGYLVPLSPRITFWPRGGPSYTRIGVTNAVGGNGNTTSTADSQIALNLEPLFVISLTTHLGISLGPVFDVPLSGTHHEEVTDRGMTVSQDTSESQLHFGITAGLLGYL